MKSEFLLYGATGFVGDAAARLAVQSGLRPDLAGRDAANLECQAAELGVEYRAFSLDDPAAMDRALKAVPVVLHCAGPFRNTSMSVAEACLRAETQYLGLTGEIRVHEALAAGDAEARTRGIMLLLGVGFDVVPTDCLAVHLKQRLPSARTAGRPADEGRRGHGAEDANEDRENVHDAPLPPRAAVEGYEKGEES
jgi:short subunit dehydrogenase-like uncharacterized protein